MHGEVIRLVSALLHHTAQKPDRVALRSGTACVSFRELRRRILTAAGTLARAGVGRGDRVLLCGTNGQDWVTAYFAIHAAGAVSVPVDIDASPATLAHALDDSGPKAVISDRPGVGPTLVRLPLTDFGIDGEPAERADASLPTDLDEVADILYTTGTSGRPKGVVLTHGNIAHAALNIATFLGQSSDDLELVPVPLSHSFGLGRLRCMALVGTALILEHGLRNPRVILDYLGEGGATGLALVPAGFEVLRRLAKDGFAAAGRGLRYVEIGSAPMSPELRAWLVRSLPRARLCHHYGLTEASRAAFLQLDAETPPGAIGAASPNVEIAIRDPDGRPLPPGSEGELCVRGAMVMREYLKQPELTREVLRDGELRTGDIGYADHTGRIFLVGRMSDIINVGGLKVAPVEVEEVLSTYAGVQDVACVGVPDPIAGERVKAFVCASQPLSSAALATWLRDQGLSPHKIPVAFEVVEVIPRTSSGKIARAELRRQTRRENRS
jgi:long-chain acyl-CoA synthetase